ncbi:family 12 carbohydrate esterase [Cryphonectria parasitica EP155]|uniref:Family 12 carbohydrate esterase n=1 Tax=Cryphonectria parasitica (strain ATCC 38755 / EP155) TaxID=660469 RepID=A0A9P4YDN1_CRYP1|nr:family 12 carbohydrate esterase [Cryphonectria parasitica EP155]KAF3771433.1 family 12 carbohydrate esterase [Cryphonectria parasitica EP155]
MSSHVTRRTYNTTKPPAFYLAGDSMTAVQSSGGGGWGVGFLSFLRSPATGIDYGVDGTTTVSFVEDGAWAEVIGSVNATKADYNTFVTIMFGANDQKAAANETLLEYQENLQNLAEEAKEAGATPILVTPLSRRDFTSETNLTQNLIDQRTYTIYAAQNTSTWWIDLNKASTEYLLAIGNASAQTYDLSCTDETHLNTWGSVVFGRMVADLLLGHVPEVGVQEALTIAPPAHDHEGEKEDGGLAEWFISNKTLSEDIWAGVFAQGGSCPLE